MMMAVKECGTALKYASDKLRGDRALVFEAVHQNGSTLQQASEEVKADKEVVLEAVQRYGAALQWASEELRADQEIVMEAVKKDGISLEYASEKLRRNKEFALWAVQQDGFALMWLSEELQADKDVVLAAVKQYSLALRWAHEELQSDKDILMLALRTLGKADVDDLCLCIEAEMLLREKFFQKSLKSAIACPGEDVPILTVSVSSGVDEVGEAVFHCEASLMSGAAFHCLIPNCSSTDRWGIVRPNPILNDLAEMLVARFPKRSEAKNPPRVFINFVVNSEDGDVMPVTVTPWDWARPLSDFLVSSTGRRT